MSAGRCNKCGTLLGAMDNYGTDEEMLCFECANALMCEECGKAVQVSEQRKINGKRMCQQCILKLEEQAKQSDVLEDIQEERTDQDITEQEKSGFFGLEKQGIKKGVVGGLIMMTIAVVWFVVGYAAGYIFYYPPILFIIGIFALVKGLATGNIAGKKSTYQHPNGSN
jgi:hypothetical protein